jgi:hypothetical protein
VIANGKTYVEDVVSRNIIEVGEGHQVPVDRKIILIKLVTLLIDWNSLKDESQSIKKKIEMIKNQIDLLINQDKHR